MLRFVTVISAVILMFSTFLQASAGTDIFPILTLHPSARSAGLGGEDGFLTSQLSMDNAANLPWLAPTELSFQYLSFLSQTNYNLISLSRRTGDSSGLALSLGYIGMGGLTRTVYDATSSDGFVQSGNFNYSDMIGALSYGFKLGYDISAGFGVKVINEAIDTTNYSGTMYSFSTLYMPTGTPWQFGAGVYNVGPQVAGYDLPGVGYFSIGKKVSPELFWIGEVDKQFDQDLECKTGFEYMITDMITLRVGYRSPTTDPGIGTFMNYNLTGGFGMRFKRFSLDYAWVPYGDLGTTHRVTLDFKFLEHAATEKRGTALAKKIIVRTNPKNISLAISYLTGKGLSESELIVISEYLRTEIANTGAFNVMSRHEMEEQFAEKNITVPQCSDEGCGVVLGKILGVDRVVVGKVSKMMGTYRISISLLNIETGETVRSLAQDVTDFGSIREACWMLAQRLSEFNK